MRGDHRDSQISKDEFEPPLKTQISSEIRTKQKMPEIPTLVLPTPSNVRERHIALENIETVSSKYEMSNLGLPSDVQSNHMAGSIFAKASPKSSAIFNNFLYQNENGEKELADLKAEAD